MNDELKPEPNKKRKLKDNTHRERERRFIGNNHISKRVQTAR